MGEAAVSSPPQPRKLASICSGIRRELTADATALRAIHLVVRHPLTAMIMGIIPLFAGVAAVLEASIWFAGAAALESHQAILVLGVIALLKGLGEMVEADDVLERAADERAAGGNLDRDARALSPER